MAKICEAIKKDMGDMVTLQDVRDKKLTGYITIGSTTFYVKDGLRADPPKSDYQLIIDELDKEFPGATIEPIAPSIEIEKAPPGLLPAMIVFAVGAFSFFMVAIL